MDVGYLKIKIDIKSEYEEYKKKYNYKKKELKKEEVKKIFDGFKEFFREDGHFKFKENEHSIAAEYKEHGVKLDMDVYKNIDGDDFNITGTIKTYEKDVFEFVAEGVPNKEMALQPPDIDRHEKMVLDTKYFKDFLDDDIVYSFQYRITGRDEIYSSMVELLVGL